MCCTDHIGAMSDWESSLKLPYAIPLRWVWGHCCRSSACQRVPSIYDASSWHRTRVGCVQRQTLCPFPSSLCTTYIGWWRFVSCVDPFYVGRSHWLPRWTFYSTPSTLLSLEIYPTNVTNPPNWRLIFHRVQLKYINKLAKTAVPNAFNKHLIFSHR